MVQPELRAPTLDDPWRWLAAGWRDLWRYPAVSLGYGTAFVLIKRGDKPEWQHTQDYCTEKTQLPAIDLDAAEFVYGGIPSSVRKPVVPVAARTDEHVGHGPPG